jgi:hypothetical protein
VQSGTFCEKIHDSRASLDDSGSLGSILAGHRYRISSHRSESPHLRIRQPESLPGYSFSDFLGHSFDVRETNFSFPKGLPNQWTNIVPGLDESLFNSYFYELIVRALKPSLRFFTPRMGWMRFKPTANCGLSIFQRITGSRQISAPFLNVDL